MEIKTSRLLLRPIREADAQAIYEYSRDSKVADQAGWKPHESVEETMEIMKAVFLKRDTVWGMERLCDGAFIGSIGLIEDPQRDYEKVRMLGYSLAKSCWGQGYMTEAARAVVRYGFEEQKLALISATCYPDNPRSVRVLEKCGMSYEGRLRLAEELYNGTIQDHLCYSITREEYESGKRAFHEG